MCNGNQTPRRSISAASRGPSNHDSHIRLVGVSTVGNPGRRSLAKRWFSLSWVPTACIASFGLGLGGLVSQGE